MAGTGIAWGAVKITPGVTPARIARLPRPHRAALQSALMEHGERPVEDYRPALQSKPSGTHPTMLIADEPLPVAGYRTLADGLRVVAYFGSVLVDDPLSSATAIGHGTQTTDDVLHHALAWLTEVRPLIAGGYITFFPLELAERLRSTAGAFASRPFGSFVTKANALETLVIASFVRGLSVRDVEAALADAPARPGGRHPADQDAP